LPFRLVVATARVALPALLNKAIITVAPITTINMATMATINMASPYTAPVRPAASRPTMP